jgi:UDP-N-acetylglucosamine 3-dehydrogenase
MRFGFLSVAHMHAWGYAGAIRRLVGCEIAGVADDDAARGARFAERFAVGCFASYDELLDQPIDAVVITSENVRHRELCERAAGKKKHVLCEKPLATTIDDAKRMIAVCEENGVRLGTAFPCRHSPSYDELRRLVRQGTVGEILALRTTNRGRNPGGWFIQKELSGGGAVMDHTVHVADLLRDLLQSEVAEVYCEASNAIGHQDFDDVGILTLTFRSGVFATLDSSWSRPKSFPTWGDVTIEVIGDRGTAYMDMFRQNYMRYSDETMRCTYEHWGDDMDTLLLRDFVDSVTQGKPPAATGEDGLRAAEVAIAAYRSAETHAPVPLPLEG